ncbi:calpain-1 catalytic subunit-like [Myripristis murdjan]|uniref:calpain-1 catalytic subunit-like n=1 Tax=Myripristis murdjan TaxID=586833 RepID=UPI001176474D|nr:calpain-1 catalytic subunit-like [Myripristis murdjan]
MPPPGVCVNIMAARHKKSGYGSLACPERFLNQDYEQLKNFHLIRSARYIDKMFPPDIISIGQGILSPDRLAKVEWKRPGVIVPNPCFTVDGVSRFDFYQGEVGNCWFLASIGALTFQKDILQQVVPLQQTFDQDYCGLFHFRFWRFGRWMDVVIDDKLPTIDGKLIFVHSRTPNEFWPALLEKAYAKVCGSYADMNAGTPSEALVDFTGGVHMSIDLSKAPSNLWQLMFSAAQSKSLMGCGTPQGRSPNTVQENGLVDGHAYTVTGVKQVMSHGNIVSLVRLLNPWGQKEWKRDWSDLSPLWDSVSTEDRNLCLSVRDDGEFWMSIEDFCNFFRDLDICSLSPSFLDGNSSCRWRASLQDGRWVASITAGGCLNDPDSFWINPQYRVKVVDSHDECAEKQEGVSFLVSLMQKPDKRNRRLVTNLYIGFYIFEVTEQYKSVKGKFPASFFKTHMPVVKPEFYKNAREVMKFTKLKPGEYLIVPSTHKPNETASFILSILSTAEIHVYETSGDFMEIAKPKQMENGHDDNSTRLVFSEHADQYEEVDAEQLQKLLNGKILHGDLKAGGFSLDACRSMVALMDTSTTGKLNSYEFLRLWKKVVAYKDIFFYTDADRTGTLSLSELRNAIMTSGIKVNDEMLNLLALRYGDATQHLTLETFISTMIRMACMHKIFKQLSDGMTMTLAEQDWLQIAMYI